MISPMDSLVREIQLPIFGLLNKLLLLLVNVEHSNINQWHIVRKPKLNMN